MMSPEERAAFVREHGRAPSASEIVYGPSDRPITGIDAAFDSYLPTLVYGRVRHDGTPLDPKTGAGKPLLAGLPWAALTEVARVLDFGAGKYGRDSWKRSVLSDDAGVAEEAHLKYASAALRHIAADLDGEVVDEESRLLALAHAACNLLFLIEGRVRRS